MFFDGWAGLGQTAVAGLLAYAGLLAVLRVSGKRTLSKMNAFDLVVTVALGSTLSTVVVSRQTPLVDGLLAMLVLVSLQFAVAWTAVRLPWFEKVVKSEPTALLVRGTLLRRALREQRVTESEVMAALRSAGVARLEQAGLVILETDGSFSVIRAEALPAGPPVIGGLHLDSAEHQLASAGASGGGAQS
jgi:uncharacterized membrane protein YcaP (DUF421 family)